MSRDHSDPTTVAQYTIGGPRLPTAAGTADLETRDEHLETTDDHLPVPGDAAPARGEGG